MPVVDRVNWLRGQIERGRHAHFSYGASSQPGIITIKVNLRPKRVGMCDGKLQQFNLGHVEAIWRLVTAHHSADRGHKLTDGTSTIRFWITLDANASLDNITYDVSDPLPVPPPAAPLTSLLDHNARGYDVTSCDRDVSLDVIDTQNNAIFALSENVADKIDKLSLAVAALRNDVNTQFGRSREQIVVGLDGLAYSLDEYIHHPRTVGAPNASILNADPNVVAEMCLAVPMDTGSPCNILDCATRDNSAQTIDSHGTLHSDMIMGVSFSRVPADASDSESDGLDHNLVMLGGNLRFEDPLFEKVVEGLGEITGVYYDHDTEERLHEIEFGDRLYSADYFGITGLCDGVE